MILQREMDCFHEIFNNKLFTIPKLSFMAFGLFFPFNDS